MAKLKLTKRSIDAIRQGENEVFYWDSEQRGLGLRVKPPGAKS
jgi:hypothetical protein